MPHFSIRKEAQIDSELNCESLLSQMHYERDVRNPPDAARRGRFRSGWEDATFRGRVYDAAALQELTWSNLGYRLGMMIGPMGLFDIGALFDQFAQRYDAIGRELPAFASADEVDLAATHREGAVRQITVNAYERNERARLACIAHYGARCVVCGFDFGAAYGDIGAGYIHVHHLRPISDIGEEYSVHPITDLRPVCPNCHAMLHRRNPPYSVEDIQKFLRFRQDVQTRDR